MMSILLLLVAFFLLPTPAEAQIDLFQQELSAVNRQYISEEAVAVTQRYFFSLDSSNGVPFDSAFCSIKRSNGITHYEFNGVEMFSDGTFLIRVSNPNRFMMVSRVGSADSSMPSFFFDNMLEGFRNVNRVSVDENMSHWVLTGGVYGVRSIEITLDLRENRIEGLAAELAADHPLTHQVAIDKSERPESLFIKVEYAYTTEGVDRLPQLSDYVVVEGESITPTGKYREYQLNVIE